MKTSQFKACIAIFVLVALQYLWTLPFPFFFDDGHSIVGNAAIQVPQNLLKIWTSASYYSASPENWGYRPVTATAHSLAWITGGGATWPFRVQKIFLHSGVAILLFLVWSRLFRISGFLPERRPAALDAPSAAFLLAAAFAIHPANTQVVNYIAATSTLLCGFWYLAAYYFYLRFREDQKLPTLFAGGAAYALSCLAKEEGVTLIAAVALTEFFLPRPAPGVRTRLFAVYGLFGGSAVALIRAMFAPSSDIARGSLPRWEYFITQWRAYLHYIGLALWPSELNADNLEFGFSKSVFEPRVIAALAGNLALLAGAWVLRKNRPILIFALIWFYVAISPASSVIPLSEPVNDHRMYLAYFGLFGALTAGFADLLGRFSPRTAFAIVVGVGISLSAGTFLRSRVWSSTEALWTDTIERNPSSGRAYNNLAIDYMGKADYTKARDLLLRCEAAMPYYSTCKINQGETLSTLGMEKEAEAKFREAIQLAPHSESARYYYGMFHYTRGRYRLAIAEFDEIEKITRGTYLPATLASANAKMALGRIAEADATIAAAESRNPGHPLLADWRSQWNRK